MTTVPVFGPLTVSATTAHAVATVAQYAQLEQIVRRGYAQHGRGYVMYVTARELSHPLIRAYVPATQMVERAGMVLPDLVVALTQYDPTRTYVVLEGHYHQGCVHVHMDIVPFLNALMQGGPRC